MAMDSGHTPPRDRHLKNATLTQSGPLDEIASGAPGLIRSFTLWLLLVPTALVAFVLAEITQIDVVDAVNALIYAFSAWVALALSRLGTPGLLDRALWLGWAVFCGFFVLSELGGDLIERAEIGWSPIWAGDALCWAITGGFIGLLYWRRPEAAVAIGEVMVLAAIGFALHSLGLLLDIGETTIRFWSGIGQSSFDNITDLLEFGYLELYLLAFIVLAAELTGKHALRHQIVAAELAIGNAATIRAAHLAFATATLTSRRFSPRRRQQAVLALGTSSGFGGWLCAVTYTRRLGSAVRAISGRSLARQFAEQLTLMRRYRLAPKYYYMFELWVPDRARHAAHYLQRGETKGAAYKLLRQTKAEGVGDEQRLSDKLDFHDRCQALELPVVPIYFAATNGRAEDAFARTQDLPQRDLFIKPRKGCGGNGASRWRYEGGFRGKDGGLRSAEAMRREIIDRSRATPLIVQPALANHAELHDINCGALATVRIVTCRNEENRFEVTCAAFRMPRSSHSVVDNFHAGGIAAAIDISNGCLGAATDMGLNPQTAWFDFHPTTKAAIKGRILPFWDQVLAVAESAHSHFDEFTVIGWDIAILADGPCIIEANGAPDLDIIQRTARRPLGNERLGRLMAWHLKRRLRAELLEEGA
jgi:hypothetical protein